MNGKKARKLRRLLAINKETQEETKPVITGSKTVYVIDSVKDELRTEERPKTQLFCDENKRLNRKLKAEYQNQSSHIGKELREDLKSGKENGLHDNNVKQPTTKVEELSNEVATTND